LLYARHARATPHAVIDLNVFRKPTFQASVVGGAFMRIAMGANPFLLAMLLQVAFGMSAFAAGMTTFISAAGALLMKTTAPPILRRFGFRSVLLVNAVIVGLSFMAYALFTPDWPHWAIMVVLGVGGFFRSLQFTALNGMAYAEIDEAEMSRATTTSSMMQQLVQSIGVGLSASLLAWLMRLHGETQLTVETVAPAFIILGLLTMISMAWFVRLAPDAGDEMNSRGAR
jgi:4-hydroxybenzoate polyprenyltransferase